MNKYKVYFLMIYAIASPVIVAIIYVLDDTSTKGHDHPFPQPPEEAVIEQSKVFPPCLVWGRENQGHECRRTHKEEDIGVGHTRSGKDMGVGHTKSEDMGVGGHTRSEEDMGVGHKEVDMGVGTHKKGGRHGCRRTPGVKTQS